MKLINQVSIVFLFALASSCAFRESKPKEQISQAPTVEAPSTEKQELPLGGLPSEIGTALPPPDPEPVASALPVVVVQPSPSPSPTPKPRWVSMTLKHRDRSVTKVIDCEVGTTCVIERPFSVEPGANDPIVVVLTSNRPAYEVESSSAQFYFDPASETAKELQVSKTSKEGGVTEFEMTLPEGFLKSETASFCVVKLGAHSGVDDSKITIKLVTPPDVPTLNLKTREEALSNPVEEGGVSAEFSHLSGFNIEAELTYVFTIENRSLFEQSIRFRPQVDAKVKTSYSEKRLTQTTCSHTVTESSRDETLSELVFLVPLESETKTQFRDWLEIGGKPNGLMRTIKPREKLQIGIYATGPQIEKIATGTFGNQRFATVAAPTKCVVECESFWYFLHYIQYKEFWESRGWPGESKLCAKILCKDWNPTLILRGYNERDCGRCFDWESTLSIPGNSEGRRCGNETETGETGWSGSIVTKEVEVGTYQWPIILSGLESFWFFNSFVGPDEKQGVERLWMYFFPPGLGLEQK